MERIIVVGAGISGISVAKILQTKADVRVLEAGKKGGLLRCETHNGHLYHLVGGHVFNTRIPEVAQWFWAHFQKDEEFLFATRNAAIWQAGTYIGYPIENFLYQLPATQATQILAELLQIYKAQKPTPSFAEICTEYSDFEDFLKRNFGPTLFEIYFRPYNQKIWQMPLQQIALPWLEGKLPMPQIPELITANIVRQSERDMVHAVFYYPRKGGSQFIIDRLAQGLQISESTPVRSIESANGILIVNGTEHSNKLIYTGDIRKLPEILSSTLAPILSPFLSDLANLRSNGTTNVLCTTDATPHSWLYLPQETVMPHRIIYTGNFSPANSAPHDRISCTVEFAMQITDAEIQTQLRKLPGNLLPISIHRQPNSYVVQQPETRTLIAKIAEILKPHGIYLLGRFAQWEYYNMDKCMEQALALANELYPTK
ncbi:MAG: hypothetical protein RIS47_308 [Bacteroidota bacterium]|jgi:protoporphyrinogen oxidase